MPHCTPETIAKIRQLRSEGIMPTQIGRMLNLPTSTLKYYLRQRGHQLTAKCIDCGSPCSHGSKRCRVCAPRQRQVRAKRKCLDCQCDVSNQSRRCIDCEAKRRQNAGWVAVPKGTKLADVRREKRYCKECDKPIDIKSKTGLCQACFYDSLRPDDIIFEIAPHVRRCSCGARIITTECVACKAREVKDAKSAK